MLFTYIRCRFMPLSHDKPSSLILLEYYSCEAIGVITCILDAITQLNTACAYIRQPSVVVCSRLNLLVFAALRVFAIMDRNYALATLVLAIGMPIPIGLSLVSCDTFHSFFTHRTV